MKKTALFILVALLAISLFAGCSVPEETTISESESATQEVSNSESDTATASDGDEVPQPDGFPTKSIEFVAPVAAGAGLDLTARMIADNIDLGEPLVVVNVSGASMVIGTGEVAAAPADGYTIMINGNGGTLIQPHITEVPYTLDDFRHISMLVDPDPQMLVVAADSEIDDFSELETMLKNGERVTYTAANPSGVGRLAAAEFLNAIGDNQAEFVPFNGANEAVPALLGGHVDAYFIDSADAITRANEGQFKLLAIMGDERSVLAPDTPTFSELGYDISSLYGFRWISVHKDTPDDIVEWLKQEINKSAQSDAYQQSITDASFTLGAYTEEEITAILNEASEISKELLTQLGMTQ